MGFLWFGRNDEKNESEKVEEIAYKPIGMTMPQKATLVGGSFLGILGVSYVLDYILYVAFGGVAAGVMFYDNEKLVGFINERAFLSSEVITQMNDYTSLVSKYLTPSQVTEGVSKGAKAVGRLRWLSQLGLAGWSDENKQTKIDSLDSKSCQAEKNMELIGKKIK